MVAGLLAIMNSSYAQPQGNPGGERFNQQAQRERGPANLNLSDEQKSKAEELRLNMQKSALPIRNQIGENKAKLRTLSTSENPDMKAINKLIDQNAELRAKLEKLRAANHQEFRKMLTEEQRVKFDSRSHGRMQNRDFQRGERHQQSGHRQGRQFKGRLE